MAVLAEHVAAQPVRQEVALRVHVTKSVDRPLKNLYLFTSIDVNLET